MPTYASWIARVAASLLDGLATGLVAAVTIVPGIAGFFITAEYETTSVTRDGYASFESTIVDANPAWLLLVAFGLLLTGLFFFWNYVWRQARSGQSLGKSVLKIRVLRAKDGQLMSMGTSFLRAILNSVLGNACFLNYLWPLWEERNRTWHDMIVDTVVVEA